jgi:hypothetical protein
VTYRKTGVARVGLASEPPWTAVWNDGTKHRNHGGFTTDIAAARHAAKMCAPAGRPLMHHTKPPPYDADIYVS